MCLFVSAQEIPQVLTLSHPSKNFERHCWGIAEDCEGLLYTATAAGVSIYNGYQWVTVPLPLNRVARCLARGEDCRVYVGGFEIFGYIDYSDPGSPRYIPVGDSLLNGTNEAFWRILTNDEGILVQSFSDIYTYDYAKLQAIPMESNLRLGATINDEYIIPLIDGTIAGISKGQLNVIATTSEGTENLKVSGIASSDNGDLLIATERSGLFDVSEGIMVPLRSPDIDHISEEQINDIIHLRSGQYVIGTVLNGLYITDDQLAISNHINKQNGLSSNSIITLHEDLHGNLWVGTDRGINVVRLSGNIKCFYDNQGMLGTVYSSTTYKDKLYLATNHGVFRRDDQGSIRLLPNSQGQTWGVHVVDDVLLCGHNNGTYQYDGTNLELISSVTGGWWMETTDSNSILQSTYTGLLLLRKDEGQWAEQRIANGNVLMRKFVLADKTIVGYHSRYGLCIATLSEDFQRIESKTFVSKIAGDPVDPAIGMFKSGEHIVIAWGDSTYLVNETELTPIDISESAAVAGDTLLPANLLAYEILLAAGNAFNLANLDHNSLSNGNSFIFTREYGYSISPIDERPKEIPIEIDHLVIGGERQSATRLDELNSSQSNIIIQLRKTHDITDDVNLSYMLEPSDDTWLSVPVSGALSFQNLASGTYTVHLADRFGNQKQLATFSVPSPWHLSWPGSILYAVVVLGIFLIWNKHVERRTAAKARQTHEEEMRRLEAQQIKMSNEQLQREVQLKSKLLANRAMSLAQKNKLLLQLRNLVQSEQFTDADPTQVRSKVTHMVDQHTDHVDEWKVFENNFDEVHEKFTERLLKAHPNLTSGDKRLASFIRMDLSSKEIAPLLRISVRSVENKRHRLRKKMELEFGQSLSEYLMRL